MSNWKIVYTPQAEQDLKNLDGSVRPQVTAAIRKVCNNPLSQREGGYGVELGNIDGVNLAGCLKIKLKKAGVRVVYTLMRRKHDMLIVIIGMRTNLTVYKEAAKRLGR